MPKGLRVVIALNIVSALLIAWAAVMFGGGFTAGMPFPPNEPIELTLEPIARSLTRETPTSATAADLLPKPMATDARDSPPRWLIDRVGGIRSLDATSPSLPRWGDGDEPSRVPR